ncbi:hypothetical protein VPH35_099290 [Triticum aestivum]
MAHGEQVKLEGYVLLQWLSRRVRSTGMSTAMRPRRLALMTVQTQTAASRSANPLSSGQHCSVSGTLIRSLSSNNTLLHTVIFSGLIGQEPPFDGVGATGGVGTKGGVGTIGGLPCTIAMRPRLRARKRATFVSAIT